MKVQPIRVVVVGQHIRLMFGQTLMHSEEYTTPAGARRAARNLVKAINERPMQLEYQLRGSWVVRKVRKLWATGNTATAMPVYLNPPTSWWPPHFEPFLGDE